MLIFLYFLSVLSTGSCVGSLMSPVRSDQPSVLFHNETIPLARHSYQPKFREKRRDNCVRSCLESSSDN